MIIFEFAKTNELKRPMPHLRTIAAILALSIAVSCTENPDPEQYNAPELGEVSVVLNNYKATISCPVIGLRSITTGISETSENGIKTGFIVSENEQNPTRTEVSPINGTLTLDIKALNPGSTYTVNAFISNGQYEVTGAAASFIVKETDPVINIPDPVFREYILEKYDIDDDGQLTTIESEAIIGVDINTGNVRSLEGIEHFVNLEGLYASDENEEKGLLRTLDLSHNKRLTGMVLNCNKMTTLILPAEDVRMREIHIWDNRLTEINVSGFPNLKVLWAGGNLFTSIDVTHNPELESLSISGDLFESGIDLTHNPKLRVMECNNALLKEIDLTANPLLEELSADRNYFTDIDLSGNPKLRILRLSNTMIKSIDLSGFPDLEEISIGGSQITSIDLSHNPKLKLYNGNDIPLGGLPDLSGHPGMQEIHICGEGGATYMDKDFFTQWPELKAINFCGYPGNEVNLSQNTKLERIWAWNIHNIRVLDLSNCPNLHALYINDNPLLETVYVHDSVDISTLEIERNNTPKVVICHKTN